MNGEKRKSLYADDEYNSSDFERPKSEEELSEEFDVIEPQEAAGNARLAEDEIVLKRLINTDTLVAVAHKNAKQRYFSDGKLKSRFGDIQFAPKASAFDDQTIKSSRFYGFYVLFWLGVALITLNTVVHYHQEHGSLLHSTIVRILLSKVVYIGLTDLAMYLSIYVSFFIQILVKKKYVSWNRAGWVLESVAEFSHLFGFLYFNNCVADYPWIGKVFLLLHSLVLLMKMHSFAFSNGYLSTIMLEWEFCNYYLGKYPKKDDTHREISKCKEFCEFELKMEKKIPSYPNNVSLKNFFSFTMFPALVYEIEYPRTNKIRWFYVFEKLCGIFGTIFLMITVAQNWMLPIAMRAIGLREISVTQRMLQYPFLLMDLIPPFLLMYLLTFFLIWELILNCIAELSFFADRHFYNDWWNCVTWDEFARDWNVPVHKWLLRHVYHSSISAFNLRKSSATVFTFFLSSLVHELVMLVIFNKLRGYLLLLQMGQLPLVSLSRTKFMKNKRTLGNVIFWLGIASGPSLMCTLYLTF